MLIYIVFGAEGEYSDHTEWAICAYYNKEQAQAHVENASQEDRRIVALLEADKSGMLQYTTNPKELKSITNAFDDKASIYRSYTGRNYYILEVALR